MNEDKRYWDMELDSKNHKDLQDWIETDELLGLVDEEAGGIIGYVNRKHMAKLLKKLEENKIC